MEDPRRTEANDLFRSYLSQTSNAAAEPMLEKLISDQAAPMVIDIVRFKIRADGESEDLRNSILAQLISRLRHLREFPDEKPIRNFRDYVAVVSYNACSEHFRRKNPGWQVLKDQLRYVLKHCTEYASWKESGRRLCGYRSWIGRPAASRDHVQTAGPDAAGLKFPQRLRKIFDALQAPPYVDDLLSVMAGSARPDAVPAAVSPEELADPQQGVESLLSQRSQLKEAWDEICQLPVKQRMALLLSLRDEEGEAILAVLPASGIATIRQIAQTLEVPAEEFAALWKGLPLEDLKIAEILGVTRQQVINLRKSARQRIFRRIG